MILFRNVQKKVRFFAGSGEEEGQKEGKRGTGEREKRGTAERRRHGRRKARRTWDGTADVGRGGIYAAHRTLLFA